MTRRVFDYPPWESDKPLIPVEITYKGGRPHPFYALVDSGADRSVLCLASAKSMGIPVHHHGRGIFKKELIRSFTGGTNTLIVPVTLTIGTGIEKTTLEDFKIHVPFDRDLNFKFLLGRPQFFDRFVITINQGDKVVVLESDD